MQNTETLAQEANNSNFVQKEQRKRLLKILRREFAKALYAKLLKKYPGTLTMKTVKGVWHLTFSYKNEKIKAQGKTLAHALIGLHSKSNCLTSKKAAL